MLIAENCLFLRAAASPPDTAFPGAMLAAPGWAGGRRWCLCSGFSVHFPNLSPQQGAAGNQPELSPPTKTEFNVRAPTKASVAFYFDLGVWRRRAPRPAPAGREEIFSCGRPQFFAECLGLRFAKLLSVLGRGRGILISLPKVNSPCVFVA